MAICRERRCFGSARPPRSLPAAIAGVSSFYDMFRHQPVGKYIVQMCHGTACHVGGAERVEDALRRHLRIPAGADTDAERPFTLERVACLGCCTLAPVVRIAEETFGYATAEKVPGAIRDFLPEPAARRSPPNRRPMPEPGRNGGAEINVCLDSCCVAKGTDRVFQALQERLSAERRRGDSKTGGLRRRLLSHADDRGRPAGPPSVTYSGLTRASGRRAWRKALFRPRGFLRARLPGLDPGTGRLAGGRGGAARQPSGCPAGPAMNPAFGLLRRPGPYCHGTLWTARPAGPG